MSCIQHQCIQGITLTLPDFGLNRTVLALQIVIKKLLVKYPQRGIAIVDGELIRASIVSGSLRTL
ncbi:hypothetical protein H6G97_51595 [Nostoc flagelliforme FACHB-838]|uniref:Transposase n=1 Tax=Nostoc flagelliforme FACHB-838 TaxID=2692904 RepID=A0ABR8E9A6_9NOSO|nr:hypothetical protein [Nostoc flagelliforme FACHB-838]